MLKVRIHREWCTFNEKYIPGYIFSSIFTFNIISKNTLTFAIKMVEYDYEGYTI